MLPLCLGSPDRGVDPVIGSRNTLSLRARARKLFRGRSEKSGYNAITIITRLRKCATVRDLRKFELGDGNCNTTVTRYNAFIFVRILDSVRICETLFGPAASSHRLPGLTTRGIR